MLKSIYNFSFIITFYFIKFQSEDGSGSLLLLYACILSRGCEKLVNFFIIYYIYV